MNITEQLRTALAGQYVIDREIGAGGMATVYLARDVRHDRPVAVKVLNPDLGAVLGVERFLAEIKVTANLQHPSLLPLFDSGEASGLLFYVMPYVEGESLRRKLMREKQLPIDEAVRIAVAIASGLDYAHQHGVIHRDLKPENVLMQSGQPVIADFGIALAVSKAGGNRVTQTGISLGTPQYMSPEQATGDRVIDGRSDIYSLGAMTYEMLTGEAPHSGSTAQAIIARVLTERPRDVRLDRSAVPEHVAAAVDHALEKLAADRYSTAREFSDALQARGAPLTTQTRARTAATRAGDWRARLREPLVLGTAFVALAAIGTAIAIALRPAHGDTLPSVQFILWTPDSARAVPNAPWPAAISPDRGTVVFSVGSRIGGSILYMQKTDQLEAHPVPGTAGASQPYFSPDGQWLGFEAAGKEEKVRLDGSAPVTVAEGSANNGVDWSANDEILVGATGAHRGLSRVSAAGGELTEFTHPDQSRGPRDHVWPIATSDGGTAVYAIWVGALNKSELAAARLADGKEVPLGIQGIRPLAVIDDAIIYVRDDGSVMAVPFDAQRLSVGKPIPVHDPVPVPQGNNGNSDVFVSRGGAMVSTRGGSFGRLAWLDRNGVERPASHEVRSFSNPRLSPDGKRIGVLVSDGQRSDVWTFDILTSTLSRLTSMETVSYFEWTRDGKYIVFAASGHSESRNAAFMQLAAGGAAPVTLVQTSDLSPVTSRSPDGKYLVAMSLRLNQWDLMRASPDSPTVWHPYLAGPAQEMAPSFSPDGRWVALMSDESGRMELYVRSFPDPSSRSQVSVSGVTSFGVWARDGQSLYYSSGSALMRARLTTNPAIGVLSRDTIVSLPGSSRATFNGGFDLAPDGRILALSSDQNFYQLVVAPNWRTELRRRLAAAKAR